MIEENKAPGTKEAIAAGCTCPVLDNCRGRGYMGMAGIFVYTESCPIHSEEAAKLILQLTPSSDPLNQAHT